MPRLADDPDSVHLALVGDGWALDAGIKSALESCLALRSSVQQALEPFRAQKKASLDAHVTVPRGAVGGLDGGVDGAGRATPDEAWLADLLIVSQVSIADGEIAVRQAEGHKCERCWKWQAQAPLCARCQNAVRKGS